MSQLITRIDGDLHARLKRLAAAEGKSLNALVNDILAREIDSSDSRAGLRARAIAGGRIVYPPEPRRVPSQAAVARATRGVGRAATEALAVDRSGR